MEGLERVEKDLDDLREDFIQTARTHVTWTTYWAITLVSIGIITGVVSYIIGDKHKEHDAMIDRIAELEKGDGGYEKRISILEERYNTIVAGINELKIILKEHDKQ